MLGSITGVAVLLWIVGQNVSRENRADLVLTVCSSFYLFVWVLDRGPRFGSVLRSLGQRREADELGWTGRLSSQKCV